MSKQEKDLRTEERRSKKWNETHKIINYINHKKCNRCNTYLPSTKEFFYQNKGNQIDGLNPCCVSCANLKQMKWHWENRDYYLKRKRKYNKHQRNTSEKWRQSEREHAKQQRLDGYYLSWQRKNPDKSRYYRGKRENKKHEITPKEWDECRQYFNFRCAYCGKTWEQNKLETKKDLHKDHLINDGRNDLKNCVPACAICNSSKGELSFNNWYNVDTHSSFLYERYYKIYLWIRYDYAKYIKRKRKLPKKD
ncbi:HNH endonuclease [Paenibacillus barcinonensis]|nr:HNH endonuclease [Paenibacillus barcinonensis]QKS55958.1 HNH endonuclease [Paenibacillus barcinonensis]